MRLKKANGISTADMLHEEWIQHRKNSIGGSDAAAILGLNKWTSPYALWAEKTGRLLPKEDNERMRQGRDLESYVAERWVEATGKKIRRCNAILKNPAYPFAHANIDRDVVGENAGLECKTTSILLLSEFKGGDFPANYYVQCVHYMAVTGADRWYLAVLVLNQGFYHYTIERDQSEIDALMAAEAQFWERVKSDTPPAIDGMDATTNALKTIYADSESNAAVDLFGRESLLDEYDSIRTQIKELETRSKEIENIIKADMEDAGCGECNGYSVHWKSQNRRQFSTEAFQKEHPDIDLSPFYKVTKSRPFRVMKNKEES